MALFPLTLSGLNLPILDILNENLVVLA